jgi:surfactin synthase thioesterase subunit
MQLFCLPYAGGGAAVYRLWADDLPSDIEVCRIQLPGREDRLDEPLLTDAVHGAGIVAAALVPCLDAPYALFGHSMGAALAYETALVLERSYGRPPIGLLASARRAPHLPGRKPPVHRLPDRLFIEELRRLNGTPREVLDSTEMMGFMLPIVRADFRLAETYQASAPVPLACPVVALGGRRDHDVSRADLEAWRAVSNGEFRLHTFEGDHFFINAERRTVIDVVRAELARFARW